MTWLLLYALAAGGNLVWLLLRDQMTFWQQACVPCLTVLLAGAGVLLRLRELSRAERGHCLRGALWVLLGYYLAILSVLLFFGGLFHMDRGWGGAVNLEPLHTIRAYLRFYQRTGSWISVLNLLGNVLIFVPLGVLLPVLLRPLRRWWLFLPLAALLAVGVEYVQYLTATGAADVDDSILNFAGAAAAFLLTRLCQLLHGVWRNRRGDNHDR